MVLAAGYIYSATILRTNRHFHFIRIKNFCRGALNEVLVLIWDETHFAVQFLGNRVRRPRLLCNAYISFTFLLLFFPRRQQQQPAAATIKMYTNEFGSVWSWIYMEDIYRSNGGRGGWIEASKHRMPNACETANDDSNICLGFFIGDEHRSEINFDSVLSTEQ